MKNKKTTAMILLWIARIWGGLSIAFLIFMIGGHIFGSEPQHLNGWRDLTAIIFFPTGVLAGLIVALKSPKTGGLIATLSFLVFFILRPDTLSGIWFYLILVPAILYLVYGFFFFPDRPSRFPKP